MPPAVLSGRTIRRRWVWPVIVVLAWGLVGLGVLVIRRIRPPDDRCAPCRRGRTAWRVLTWTLAALTVAGSVSWVYGEVVDEPAADCVVPATDGRSARALGPAEPEPGWHAAARTVLTAPASGIAYAYTSPRAQRRCDAGPLTLTLMPGVEALPSAASDGGVTVGSVFMTGLEPADTPEYLEHESAHVDQWAWSTLAGGLLAQPVLYSVDDTFFPDERNHFERAAGLRGGDYEPPPSFGPKPRWPGAAVIAIIVLLCMRTSARRATRAVAAGMEGLRFTEPGRCPRHSRGWFRGAAPPAPDRSAASNSDAQVEVAGCRRMTVPVRQGPQG